MKDWTKCPSVTPGGRPFFYKKGELTVIWDRFNETWLIRQWHEKYKEDVAIPVNGFYHHKTATAAMKAAELIKQPTKGN